MEKGITTFGTTFGTIPFIKGLKMAWLSSALSLALWCLPSQAQTFNNDKNTNITELNDVLKNNTGKVIDFNTARKNLENHNSNAKVDSLMNEYRKKYFQYLDSLSDQEKQDLILEISMNTDKIEKIINKMINDEDVIKAIKLWDKKAVEDKFLDIADHKIWYTILGLVIVFVWYIILGFGWTRIQEALDRDIDYDDKIWTTMINIFITILFTTVVSLRISDKKYDKYEIQKFENMEINNSNSLEKSYTANTVVFDTTITKAPQNNENCLSESDFKSKITEYRDKYFQYWNNLSDQEKKDFISEISKNSGYIKKTINDMLKDENVIQAIKLWDEKYIQEKFYNNHIRNKNPYIRIGLYILLALIGLEFVFEKID